jgi:DNA-binding Xre family transcriptional regulator
VDDKDFRKILGKNIQRLRAYKGLQAKELAEIVGITAQTMSGVEKGKQENLGLKTLLKICDVLQVGPEELFMENKDLLSLRFVISDRNIQTLKEVAKIIENLIEAKKE